MAYSAWCWQAVKEASMQNGEEEKVEGIATAIQEGSRVRCVRAVKDSAYWIEEMDKLVKKKGRVLHKSRIEDEELWFVSFGKHKTWAMPVESLELI